MYDCVTASFYLLLIIVVVFQTVFYFPRILVFTHVRVMCVLLTCVVLLLLVLIFVPILPVNGEPIPHGYHLTPGWHLRDVHGEFRRPW